MLVDAGFEMTTATEVHLHVSTRQKRRKGKRRLVVVEEEMQVAYDTITKDVTLVGGGRVRDAAGARLTHGAGDDEGGAEQDWAAAHADDDRAVPGAPREEQSERGGVAGGRADGCAEGHGAPADAEQPSDGAHAVAGGKGARRVRRGRPMRTVPLERHACVRRTCWFGTVHTCTRSSATTARTAGSCRSLRWKRSCATASCCGRTSRATACCTSSRACSSETRTCSAWALRSTTTAWCVRGAQRSLGMHSLRSARGRGAQLTYVEFVNVGARPPRRAQCIGSRRRDTRRHWGPRP